MRVPFFQTFFCAAALSLAATTLTNAQEALQLMFGPPEGRHATIAFSPEKSGDEAIVVTTHQAGVAGSRLQLAIDRSGDSLIDRILTIDECRFDGDGSLCRFAIAGGSAEYAAIVEAFRRGLTLHIELTNAGSMEMSEDVSLKGFTKAYGKL